MMIWGQLLKAGLEHNTSNPTTAWKGRLYWNTTDDVPKVYDGSNWIQIVALDSNGILNLEKELVIKELASTPSTPSSGYKAIYAKNDGKVYQLDDAGTELEIGSGGSGGGINQITNPSASTDNSDYGAYDDGASATPVDGTGGGESVTFTDTGDLVTLSSHGLSNGDLVLFTSITTTTGISANTFYYVISSTTNTFQVSLTSGGAAIALTTDGSGSLVTLGIARNTTTPIRGEADFRIYKPAIDCQGLGISTVLDFDDQDTNKVLSLSFDYDATVDTDYASDDVAVYIYDVTNSTLITPSGDNGLKAAKTTYSATWVSTDSTSYRLVFHVTSTNAAAYSLAMVNLKSGPELAAQGVPRQGWTEYDMTITGTTSDPSFATSPALNKAYWARDGQDMLIRFSYNHTSATGASAGSGTYIFGLPSGYTLDTSVISNIGTAHTQALGSSSWRCGTDIYSGHVQYYEFSASKTGLIAVAATGGTSSVVLGSGTGSLGNSTVRIGFECRIPISEWAGSSVNLSVAKAEYAFNSDVTDAADTTSFAYGPSGVQFGNFTASRTKRVRFLQSIQPTDRLELQIKEDAGWISLGQGDVVRSYSQQSSNSYGMGLVRVSSSTTDVDVIFGAYRAQNSGTYGSAGGAWSDIDATDTFKWRVVKYPGVIQTATPANVPSSQVSCDTGNGHGSTNNRIRRFTNSTVVGTAITYADSSTAGATFTINKTGIYSMSYTDRRSTGTGEHGFSLNASVLTGASGSLQALAASERLMLTFNGSTNYANVSWTGRLSAGDIIRAQTSGNENAASALVQFVITQVAVL